MKEIHKSMLQLEDRFDRAAGQFVMHHPMLGFCAMFVGIPLFILVSVCVCTASITVPIACLLGWL